MDWAELQHGAFFPGPQPNLEAGAFTYRFYPSTGNYIGVENGRVYVLGPISGMQLADLGGLADFTCSVFPEACHAPIASAGPPQQVLVGSTVTLDGRGTQDFSGWTTQYFWTALSKPQGSAAGLSGAGTAQPTFLADVAGTYVFQLVAANGYGLSAPATVTLTAVSANVPPVAVTGGSRSVVTGTTIFLDGSQSYDQNGDPVTYLWTLSKPAGSGAVLVGSTTATASFVPDVAGVYTATLVVKDAQASSQPSVVSFNATRASSYCCRRCTTGKPCGDSCISRSYTCHVGGGCACY
jgi:hypothetical protein